MNDSRMMEFLKLVILSNEVSHDIKEKALDLYSGQVEIKYLDGNSFLHAIFISSLKWKEINDLIKEGNPKKIMGIKLLREATGLGLRECKDAIEKVSNFPNAVHFKI